MKRFYWIIIFIFVSFQSRAVFYRLDCHGCLLDKAVQIAKSQVGLRERTGHNDGEHIENYLSAVGLNPKGRYPYCAAGIYWSFKEASRMVNKEIPIKQTPLANGIFNDAMRRGKKTLRMPRQGDLLVWRLKKSIHGHIEMIFEPIGEGLYKTIAFNTSGAKGQGNYYKVRSLFNPLGRLLVRGVVVFRRVKC